MQTPECTLDRAQRLGAGVNGEVHVFSSPLFPGAVLKSGRQGWLNEEASFTARLHHPNIVRVLARVIPHGISEDPNQPGFLAMERLGAPLRNYTVPKSALLPYDSVNVHQCLGTSTSTAGRRHETLLDRRRTLPA